MSYCRDCKFWRITVDLTHKLGWCANENIKICGDDGGILTDSDFGCVQFEPNNGAEE